MNANIMNALKDSLNCGQIDQDTYDALVRYFTSDITPREFVVKQFNKSFEDIAFQAKTYITALMITWSISIVSAWYITNATAVNKFFAAIIGQ